MSIIFDGGGYEPASRRVEIPLNARAAFTEQGRPILAQYSMLETTIRFKARRLRDLTGTDKPVEESRKYRVRVAHPDPTSLTALLELFTLTRVRSPQVLEYLNAFPLAHDEKGNRVRVPELDKVWTGADANVGSAYFHLNARSLVSCVTVRYDLRDEWPVTVTTEAYVREHCANNVSSDGLHVESTTRLGTNHMQDDILDRVRFDMNEGRVLPVVERELQTLRSVDKALKCKILAAKENIDAYVRA